MTAHLRHEKGLEGVSVNTHERDTLPKIIPLGGLR